MPYKVFAIGAEALAADANNMLMEQTVARFTTATQRSTDLVAPELNQLSMTDDRPVLQRWSGTAWVDMPGTLCRWAATNPNQVVASATDFTLTSFTMPFTGQVQFQGQVFCGTGAGATALEIAMSGAVGNSTPAPAGSVSGAGGSMPANLYYASFPVGAVWNLAAGTLLTIRITVASSAPGSMGAQLASLMGQVIICPTGF